MKILLSWLNEYGDFGDPADDDVDALADTMTSTRPARSTTIDHVGATVAGVVTARVLRTERHPDAAKVHRVYVDAGDGVERHVWCGAFNMQPGDVVPLATLGTTMPDGRTIEPARHPRHRLRGHAVLGARARPRRRPRRHPHPPRRARRSACRTATPSGSTADVSIDLDVTRNRPDCWGYVGVARDLAAQLGIDVPTADARARRSPASRRAGATVEHRRRRRAVRGSPRRSSRGVRVGPSRRLDGAPAHRRRHAPDQQRRRRQQLRDARAQPAEPRLRPRHARRRRVPRPPRAATARRMTTLDGIERTFTADDLLICDANDTPIGLGRDHGRPRHRDQRRDDHVALEMAWFEPIGDRPRPRPASACAREASAALRARRRPVRHRPRPSPASSSCCARPVPISSCTPAPVDARTADLPAAPTRSTCASPRSTAILGTALVGRRSRRVARPDRLHGDRRRRRSNRGAAVVATRLRPPRSTSSRRSPATTATTALGKTVPKSVVHGGLTVAPAAPPPAARGAARARDLRGDAEPVPGARHARARRARRPRR